MKELKKYGKVLEDVNLKNYNTYKINAEAKYLIKPFDALRLKQLIVYLKDHNLKYFILGNGSNIIIPNTKFNGVIIKLDFFDKIVIKDQIITVGSGVMLPKLVQEVINHNLKGLEWASGIPGEIGGSIVSNAGAYKSCIFDYLKSVKVLINNEEKILSKEEILYDYRWTMFKENKEYIILECTLELEKGNKEESLALIKDRYQRRVSSQPLEYPSAGSVFRNPENEFAGHLIEELGFKNKNIGGAYVSEKHANFIINKNNATTEDIISLINEIKQKVLEKYNIKLILEQEIIEW